jgi:hypothetical protein
MIRPNNHIDGELDAKGSLWRMKWLCAFAMHPIVIRAQVRRPLSSRDISPLRDRWQYMQQRPKAFRRPSGSSKQVKRLLPGPWWRPGPVPSPTPTLRQRLPRRYAAPVPRPDDVASLPVHGAVGSDATARQVRRLGSAVPTVPLGLGCRFGIPAPACRLLFRPAWQVQSSRAKRLLVHQIDIAVMLACMAYSRTHHPIPMKKRSA